MDDTQFETRAQDLINNFLQRLPPVNREFFRDCLTGGELTYAIVELPGIISRDPVPMSDSERQQLRELLTHLGKEANFYIITPIDQTENTHGE